MKNHNPNPNTNIKSTQYLNTQKTSYLFQKSDILEMKTRYKLLSSNARNIKIDHKNRVRLLILKEIWLIGLVSYIYWKMGIFIVWVSISLLWLINWNCPLLCYVYRSPSSSSSTKKSVTTNMYYRNKETHGFASEPQNRRPNCYSSSKKSTKNRGKVNCWCK